jgi:hypothetical protein
MEPDGNLMMKRTVSGLIFSAGLILAAYVVLRPLMRRWGTRADESWRPLPGDDLILHPHIAATYAIDIQAPPRIVWFWLLRMVGVGFDALRDSAQTVRVAEETVFSSGYRVVEFESERHLVLSGPADSETITTHIWLLEAVSPNQTRVIFRYWRANFGLFGVFHNILSEPAQFILRNAMLKALRERSQRGGQPAILSKEKANGNIRIPLEN